MRGLLITRDQESREEPGYSAPTVTVEGEASSAAIGDEDFSLWALRAHLGAGTTLQWSESHGDEGLYVLSGGLEHDGRKTEAGGAVLVEAGVPAQVRASEPSVVLHFAPRDAEPPTSGPYGAPRADRGVHVVGPGGTYAESDEVRETRFFADSTCDNCRITLFYTSRRAFYNSSRHTHSQDEILYLLHGEITLGSQTLHPGDAIMVAADQPYAFHSGPDGFGFLNYRRDASMHTVMSEGVARLEGGRVHNMTFVNDVR
jgi:quercetin dioxygenase-like cupin family protein